GLEEPPPQTLFLLVSHAPGKLLPTIRSRCRTLRFSSLDDTAMATILRDQLADADPGDIAALVRSAEGSPGRALAYAGLGIAELDRLIDTIEEGGEAAPAARATLSRLLNGKAAQARYELFLSLIPPRIAARARAMRGDALAQAIALWERARQIA